MRFLLCKLLLLLVMCLGLASPAQAQFGGAVVQTEQVRAELLAHAPEGIAPGKPLWLGLKLEHQPGWHTYWKNSGDSGLPTELVWNLPAGMTAGDIAWPTPHKFPIGELANYGYDRTVVLPVPVTVSSLPAATHVEVALHAAWLVCRQECIPEEGDFKLRIPVHGSTALHTSAFETAWSAAPQTLPAKDSSLTPDGEWLKVSLTALPGTWRGQPVEIFPELPGLIAPGLPWTQAWTDAGWEARIPLSPQRSDSPALVPLVLALAGASAQGVGPAGVRLDVPVKGAWPATTTQSGNVSPALAAALEQNVTRAAQAPTTNDLTLWLALVGALIGGVVLNLMPCVFPILAIKVLAFAQHADDRRGHRIVGLAYTAGVVTSFLALGGLLLVLRSAGEQLGWGFQLQNPAVVAGLATLFTLIGLNLAGLFEFGTLLPSSLASLEARHPAVDAFLTGVLATAIASPCTAPFMGASLGFAIGLPTWLALAVFAALGLGMALPYLLASWVPTFARALPRPGAWMETFRQFMAFPMFGTVVWLLWVLGQQSGIDGTAALLALLVAFTLLIWSLGRQGRLRTILGSLALASLVWLLWSLGPTVTRTLVEPHLPSTPASSNEWAHWTPDLQERLLAEGRPVFVDFTAAWCVTCQFNKRTTLADETVKKGMADRNVALLRADWTRRDPLVTEALARLGRSGVPVYVFYAKGKLPVVLSEILSVNEVLAALAQL